MINLFTYGSLMCSDIMLHAAGQQTNFAKATLKNFFCSKIRDREYPGIIPQAGTIVSGVLYYNLESEAIRRLDVFEGEMYQRQNVDISTNKDESTKAMAYVIKPQHVDLLTGEEWNFEDFLTMGKEKFIETYFGFQDIDL